LDKQVLHPKVKKLLNQWPQVHFVLVLEMSDLRIPDRVQAGTPAVALQPR
jgi:hypothetical protein